MLPRMLPTTLFCPSSGATGYRLEMILRSGLYSFVQVEKGVRCGFSGGECQAPCREEARKVGEIAVYFRAHAIDSIARRQYRAVISVRGHGNSCWWLGEFRCRN